MSDVLGAVVYHEGLGRGRVLSVDGAYASVQFDDQRDAITVKKNVLSRTAYAGVEELRAKLDVSMLTPDVDEVDEGIYGIDDMGGYECCFFVSVDVGELVVTNIRFFEVSKDKKGKFVKLRLVLCGCLTWNGWRYYPDQNYLTVPSYKQGNDYKRHVSISQDQLKVIKDIVGQVWSHHNSQ